MDEEARTACRGVRGAITVGEGAGALTEATALLLDGLLEQNGCMLDDVAAAIFTLPPELAGTNPAAAARAHGWEAVPLLMVKEAAGESPVPRCLRILLLVNTTRGQADVRHVYLGGAAALRPDLVARGGSW